MHITYLGGMLAMKWPNARIGSASITFICETAARKTPNSNLYNVPKHTTEFCYALVGMGVTF